MYGAVGEKSIDFPRKPYRFFSDSTDVMLRLLTSCIPVSLDFPWAPLTFLSANFRINADKSAGNEKVGVEEGVSAMGNVCAELV